MNKSKIAFLCGLIGMIASIVLSCVPFVQYVAFVLSAAGIVFGVMAKKDAKSANIKDSKANAGFVLGIIGVVFAGISIAFTIFGAAELGYALGTMVGNMVA